MIMHTVNRRDRDNPSFSSTLLDEIYRSIDERNDEELAVSREKQSKFRGIKSCFEDDHDERRDLADLRRIQKWMENKVSEKAVVGRKSAADLERSSLQSERYSLFFNSSSSSSDSSCGGGFPSSEAESIYGVPFKPKPIRTSIHQHDEFIMPDKQRSMYGQNYLHENSQPKPKHEGKFMKTKSKALKIYSDLKKVRQPISPGGRLATFLNSLFTTGNTKKPKISSTSATGSGGHGEATRNQLDRKSKSANASTCSSASSFSRSCLSNTPSSRGKLSNGMKRSVRFYPVSVIVDEDCQPCGHKSLYEDDMDLESVNFAKISINKELKVRSSDKNRHVEEAARNLLKNYQKKVECEFESVRNNIDMNDDEEDEDEESDDGKSYSSSDLFELRNLSTIGMDKYREELPVYETTHLDTNRAIANGLLI